MIKPEGKVGKKHWYVGVFLLICVFVVAAVLCLLHGPKETYSILIVGDSIGEGAGASEPVYKWYRLLAPFLEEKFQCQVEITNVSIGGSTSYGGYVKVMELDSKEEFDLIIICYGENDAEEEFSLYYEALLRALHRKYPASPKLAILESSQREYSVKIKMIQSLCQHYGVYIADTIQGFAESGLPYDTLCDDGVHPNNEGQRIYYETVKAAIEALPVGTVAETVETIEPMNEKASEFTVFQYVPLEQFHKVDELTYELAIKASGRLGIDYTSVSGVNEIYVTIDGRTLADRESFWAYDFQQQRIEVLLNECVIKDTIRIHFSSVEQAANFHGIMISS